MIIQIEDSLTFPRSIPSFASMRLGCQVPADGRWFIKFPHIAPLNLASRDIAYTDWNRQ